MQYQTITLELIEQRTHWHQQLRVAGTLLSTMQHYASQLRQLHLQCLSDLMDKYGETESPLLRSQALELAVKDLTQEHFPAEPNEEDETIPLDAAGEFLSKHTPRA